MSYKVMSGSKVIETWDTPAQAHKALLILSAHEVLAGRIADFRIEPPCDLDPRRLDEIPLWVKDALK